jgi:DNA invertase Pin-like site-specific DNA recombinase
MVDLAYLERKRKNIQKKHKMTKAFIYLRVSTDDKGQDPQLQLKDCRQVVVDNHDITEDEVFKEEVSAYSDKERPVFDS